VAKTEDAGVTYYSMKVPSGKNVTEIVYAFVDGYLVVSTSHDAVAEAVQLHASGGALGKSKKFLAVVPPNEVAGQSAGKAGGHAVEASALLYDDPGALAALQLRQLGPGLANPLAQAAKESAPSVVCLYGEESAIREASANSAMDFGAVVLAAAVAIPNLLRSKMAANEASAVGSIRSVNTAQVAYAAEYPKRGFAAALATLGVDPHSSSATSAEHMGLLNQSLAGAGCTGEAWCTKSGYQFRVSAVCKLGLCKEYVVVARPVNENSGTRNFCSTSDGVVRAKTGPPLTSPVSVSECQTWQALK